jgi:hypothetical protein
MKPHSSAKVLSVSVESYMPLVFTLRSLQLLMAFKGARSQHRTFNKWFMIVFKKSLIKSVISGMDSSKMSREVFSIMDWIGKEPLFLRLLNNQKLKKLQVSKSGKRA